MSDFIYELDETEKEWWGKTIKTFRNLKVKEPSSYASKALENLNISDKEIAKNPNAAIKNIRERAWNFYIQDELNFHKDALAILLKERPKAKEILQEVLKTDIGTKSEAEDNGVMIGDYMGRAMPYIYQLTLSTTNSRRSRAGKTLEWIIKRVLMALAIPFEDQKSLGKDFHRKNRLGKIVDLIIPSGEVFEKSRKAAMIVTMKTSLRERWAEVVEELTRTNIPNIHLLTLDHSISEKLIKIFDNYNITLVVYDEVKSENLRTYNNVMGFTKFFDSEIPHYLATK